MARKSDGTVYIDTLIDTKGFGKGMNTMQGQINGLMGSVKKLGAAIGIAFGIKQLVDFGKNAIELGSDLQEVQNVVDVTFGDMSNQIDEFAKNAIEQFGLSELAAKQYSSTMGAMIKSMGFDSASALEMSKTLTGLAGDMASFYNLASDDAFAKIRAGISGETEPLKQLGINLSVANLEAFALAKGITKSYNAMTEQEKVMLRYNYLLQATADAQGDFERTSDSWANQTRILSEKINSIMATFGQGLINFFAPVIKIVNVMIEKLATLANSFKALSEMIMGTASGGGGSGTNAAAEALGELEAGYEGVEDGAKKAEKANKKYLTGLDEIKTFATDSGEENSFLNTAATSTSSGNKPTDEGNETVSVLDSVALKVKELIDIFKNQDWESLGKYLSDGIASGLSYLNDKIEAINWEQIGTDIGAFLEGIDWNEALSSVGGLIWSAITASLTLWGSTFDAAPIETGILTGIALLNFTPLGGIVAQKITSAILPIITPIATEMGNTFLAGLSALLGSKAGASALAFITPFTKMFTGIGTLLAGIGLAVTNFVDMFVNGFSWIKEILMLVGIALAAVGAVILGAPALVAGVVAAIVAAVSTLAIVIKDNWQTIKDTTIKIWNGIWGAIKSVINLIIGGINGMISGIVSGINGMIKALNALKFDVPDWVPLIGGGTFGLNIKTVTAPKIPYLATGAVIPPNAPFMAMLGDQKHGTNIEAPLDTIKQAVREVVGTGHGGSYQFIAQINRRTLFDEMIDEAKMRQVYSGHNPFELA